MSGTTSLSQNGADHRRCRCRCFFSRRLSVLAAVTEDSFLRLRQPDVLPAVLFAQTIGLNSCSSWLRIRVILLSVGTLEKIGGGGGGTGNRGERTRAEERRPFWPVAAAKGGNKGVKDAVGAWRREAEDDALDHRQQRLRSGAAERTAARTRRTEEGEIGRGVWRRQITVRGGSIWAVYL